MIIKCNIQWTPAVKCRRLPIIVYSDSPCHRRRCRYHLEILPLDLTNLVSRITPRLTHIANHAVLTLYSIADCYQHVGDGCLAKAHAGGPHPPRSVPPPLPSQNPHPTRHQRRPRGLHCAVSNATLTISTVLGHLAFEFVMRSFESKWYRVGGTGYIGFGSAAITEGRGMSRRGREPAR